MGLARALTGVIEHLARERGTLNAAGGKNAAQVEKLNTVSLLLTTALEAAGSPSRDVLDDRELAAVLAGLRLLQHHKDGTKPDDVGIEAIVSQAGEETPLTNDEIDALCMRLNLGSIP